MMLRIKAIAGALPDVMTADAGYWSEDNAKTCAKKAIEASIPKGRLTHGPYPQNLDRCPRMLMPRAAWSES
jgi:hypothetical protein